MYLVVQSQSELASTSESQKHKAESHGRQRKLLFVLLEAIAVMNFALTFLNSEVVENSVMTLE